MQRASVCRYLSSVSFKSHDKLIVTEQPLVANAQTLHVAFCNQWDRADDKLPQGGGQDYVNSGPFHIFITDVVVYFKFCIQTTISWVKNRANFIYLLLVLDQF